MPVINDTPGSRLRQLRKAAGLSAGQLGKRIGRVASAITNHENSINGIRAEIAALYAAELGTTPQYILYGGDQPPARPRAPASPVTMTSLPGGKAQLEMSVTLPFSVALQILALVDEAQK